MPSASKHGRALRVGRSDAKELEHAEQDAVRVERELNAATAETERELAEMREKLALARKELTNYQALHKRWVLGDYSDLAPNHPFEITIFTDEDPRRNHPAYVCINGDEWRIPRGIAWRVPRNVIDVLATTKVKTIQRLAQADGTLRDIPILESRYHFTARPIYTE